MFDARLRPTKQRILAPLVDLAAPVPPIAVTLVGLAVGLSAAVAAADQRWSLALTLFAANRLLDGLDGDIARARSVASDHGGYADIVADTVVYAAVPLGAAVGSDLDHIWPIAGLLLASFYLNATTWMYLAALVEKQRQHDDREVATAVVMPVGLVEGGETILFFGVMLAVPSILDWTMAIMAAAVAMGATVRFFAAHRRLRTELPANERVRA